MALYDIDILWINVSLTTTTTKALSH